MELKMHQGRTPFPKLVKDGRLSNEKLTDKYTKVRLIRTPAISLKKGLKNQRRKHLNHNSIVGKPSERKHDTNLT